MKRALVLAGVVMVQQVASLQLQPPKLSTLSQQPLSPPELGTAPLSVPEPDKKLRWNLGKIAFSLLPLAPGDRRKTMEEEVVPGKVWTHDQVQGVVNVNVPVRQTVIKLKSGGLWVHNPVAPTMEHLEMIRALEAKHGTVEHIVLGTVGLEHKALAGPFARMFPKAQVWLQPGQWSFPVALPNALFGFPGRTKTLPKDPAEVPWADEIDYAMLGPFKFKSVGNFGETAFFHKDTSTVLVTDTIVKVEEDPPGIIQEDPRALLFHARDYATEEVADSKANREKGWRRMVQFGLIFFPSSIEVSGVGEALADSRDVPESMKPLGTGAVPLNLYPWRWERDDVESFKALRNSGGNPAGILVAPILQKLILDREPDMVLDWVNEVSWASLDPVSPLLVQ